MTNPIQMTNPIPERREDCRCLRVPDERITLPRVPLQPSARMNSGMPR